jgi:hypothetical protein
MTTRKVISMARLNGMFDIGEFLGGLIVHDLGDYRRHRRFGACCLLSNFRSRFLIYVSLPRRLWLRLCARFCEFPIPDVLNLGLKGL